MSTLDYIRHFALRAAFGVRPTQLEYLASLTDWQAYVDAQLTQAASASRTLPDTLSSYDKVPETRLRAMLKEQRKKFYSKYRQDVKLVIADWFDVMWSEQSHPVAEKIALFWHSFFVCHIDKSFLAVDYIALLRREGFTNFKSLLLAVAKSGAMLAYLDAGSNTKDDPNENFAREIMELFSMGVGNYTESDVREAARAFTGWRADSDGDFKVRGDAVDRGTKQIFGKQSNFDGEDVIALICEHPATPTYLAERMIKYFVSTKPRPDDVAALATYIRKVEYDLPKIYRYLFTDERYYKAEYVGNRIKSPVELLVGLFQCISVDMPEQIQKYRLLKYVGHILLEPRDVGGWPLGREWINPATLLFRLNLLKYLSGDPNYSVEFNYEAEDADAGTSLSIDAPIRYDKLVESIRSATRPTEALLQLLLAPGLEVAIKSGTDSRSLTTSAVQIVSSLEYQLS